MRPDGPPAQRPTTQIKALYICGLGRSGSTLLDRMLGQIPGFCSVGELREIWHRGLEQNTLCGCGAAFRECPFWTKVGDHAFGGWDSIDGAEVRGLAATVDRHRFLPFLMGAVPSRAFDERLRRYVAYLEPLYRAIHEVGDTRVIIDSSKAPSTALLLRRIPLIDLRILHLIRDSRGVAYSWQKTVRRPDMADQDVYMHRFQPGRTAARWITNNALAEWLARRPPGGVRVTYETMIPNPASELSRVLSSIGEPARPGELDFASDGMVDLEPTHTVMGNPGRMESGPTRLSLDEEWRDRMAGSQRSLVTVLTWALLRRYGYTP